MSSSLARALTTRRKEESTSPTLPIGRAASQRAPNSKPIKRSQISLPVALLSTTNVLSYEAPDIANAPHVNQMGGRDFSSSNNSISSAASGDESEHSAGYLTDATSVSPSTPELCHDSDHFNDFFSSPSSGRSRSTASSRKSSRESRSTSHSSQPSIELRSPVIPSRAPSHSKNAHVLSHSRSLAKAAPAATPVILKRDSLAMFSADEAVHPFGRELAQLNEVAEEFGYSVHDAEADADRQVMLSKDLAHFGSDEYVNDILSFFSNQLDDGVISCQPVGWF